LADRPATRLFYFAVHYNSLAIASRIGGSLVN
jgi:hypothetical protein